MDDKRDLEGLSALVTGAASGISKAAAEEPGRCFADDCRTRARRRWRLRGGAS